APDRARAPGWAGSQARRRPLSARQSPAWSCSFEPPFCSVFGRIQMGRFLRKVYVPAPAPSIGQGRTFPPFSRKAVISREMEKKRAAVSEGNRRSFGLQPDKTIYANC